MTEPQGEYYEVPEPNNPQPPDLEQRFAALADLAESVGCDLTLSLVIGGIKRNERYRVYETSEPDATISEMLDILEAQLNDVRLREAAKAAQRMLLAEAIGRDAVDLVKHRQEEYRNASLALQQAYEFDARPEDGDALQERLGDLVAMTRDDATADLLVDIVNAEKERRAAKKLDNKSDAETPEDPAE